MSRMYLKLGFSPVLSVFSTSIVLFENQTFEVLYQTTNLIKLPVKLQLLQLRVCHYPRGWDNFTNTCTIKPMNKTDSLLQFNLSCVSHSLPEQLHSCK